MCTRNFQQSQSPSARRCSKYLKSVSICLSTAFCGSILLTPDPPSSTGLNPNTTGLMASLHFPAGLTYKRGESGTVWLRGSEFLSCLGLRRYQWVNPFSSPQLPFRRLSPNPSFIALFALLSSLMLSSVSRKVDVYMHVCLFCPSWQRRPLPHQHGQNASCNKKEPCENTHSAQTCSWKGERRYYSAPADVNACECAHAGL